MANYLFVRVDMRGKVLGQDWVNTLYYYVLNRLTFGNLSQYLTDLKMQQFEDNCYNTLAAPYGNLLTRDWDVRRMVFTYLSRTPERRIIHYRDVSLATSDPTPIFPPNIGIRHYRRCRDYFSRKLSYGSFVTPGVPIAQVTNGLFTPDPTYDAAIRTLWGAVNTSIYTNDLPPFRFRFSPAIVYWRRRPLLDYPEEYQFGLLDMAYRASRLTTLRSRQPGHGR